jgi:hypothetical protein
MANKSVKIRYIKAYDFKIALATGVFGGLTSNGLINVNFFHERTVIPDSQIVELDDDGNQVGRPIDEKDGDLTRELQSGILLDVKTAKIVLEWLQGKLEQHETIFGQQSK